MEKVRLGQFTSYEIEGHELSGTVQEIQPSEEEKEDSDGSEDDRRVVKISLPADLSFNLRPGVKATVKFVLDS